MNPPPWKSTRTGSLGIFLVDSEESALLTGGGEGTNTYNGIRCFPREGTFMIMGCGPSDEVRYSAASGTNRGALNSAFRQVSPNGWLNILDISYCW